jgi:hypothetical protein
VLDTGKFSTIIYIWYEGGHIRPPLVRLMRLGHIDLALSGRKVGRCLEAQGADIG